MNIYKMSDAPQLGSNGKTKRDKENNIIENWDNKILRKAQRAYELCGETKLIIDSLKWFTTEKYERYKF